MLNSKTRLFDSYIAHCESFHGCLQQVPLQVCDPGMAVAIEPHPTHISRGTQTVQGTKRLPSFTARQALANQSHQHRHNRSAVTSHTQLQPDSLAAHTSKASAVSIHRTGAPEAARSSEKHASQNSHPNLPTSCQHSQLQVCAGVHCS